MSRRTGFLREQVNGKTPPGFFRPVGTAAVVGQVMVKAEASGRQDDLDLFPGLAGGTAIPSRWASRSCS